MSSSDADDVVEVTTGGVTVTKSYTADEFPVPAVRFEFESEHDEPVEVRLAEDIPESFPMDSVGFHPDYHSDQWTAFQDNHVQFVGNVDPDEPLVTVYGIRLSEDTDPGAFLSEPTITVEGDATQRSRRKNCGVLGEYFNMPILLQARIFPWATRIVHSFVFKD